MIIFGRLLFLSACFELFFIIMAATFIVTAILLLLPMMPSPIEVTTLLILPMPLVESKCVQGELESLVVGIEKPDDEERQENVVAHEKHHRVLRDMIRPERPRII